MVKCHLCGRLRAIGRACVCGGVMVFSLAMGERHVETTRFDPPPAAPAVVLSSARTSTGGMRLNAEPGRYVLTGFAVSTGSHQT